MSRIRLYVDHPLGAAQRVPLSQDQAHYLFGVMRLGVGDPLTLFNGADGAWQAEVTRAAKKNGDLVCIEQTAPQVQPPDVWLVCAPIRKERMSFVVEKAVELGAAAILPVQTEYTQDAKRLRVDRLRAIAVEAAEQCGATYVPEVMELTKFAPLLADWESSRRILFCDEAMAGQDVTLPQDNGPWAIFIGPEGGFSSAEREKLQSMTCAHPISLGPRILRAETAAVAALTLWQNSLGDWG